MWVGSLLTVQHRVASPLTRIYQGPHRFFSAVRHAKSSQLGNYFDGETVAAIAVSLYPHNHRPGRLPYYIGDRLGLPGLRKHVILSSPSSFLLLLVAAAVVQITVPTHELQYALWCQDPRATKKLIQDRLPFGASTCDASYSGRNLAPACGDCGISPNFRAVPYPQNSD